MRTVKMLDFVEKEIKIGHDTIHTHRTQYNSTIRRMNLDALFQRFMSDSFNFLRKIVVQVYTSIHKYNIERTKTEASSND